MQTIQATSNRVLEVIGATLLTAPAALNVIGAWCYLGLIPVSISAISMRRISPLRRVNNCLISRG
jgi:hypothetical protein